ncbi:MAG: helix-hairpin-helix domain-containing protein [Eubacteriales bacterium]|nr:helix-hairpin-helix domain-containing protein [Oscillospiraceae bacterium]MDO5459265.1 helix-hairpin-helix domain-containing protein [Eubacteriales bacterium]
MKKSAALLLSLLLTCAFLLYLVLSFPRPSGGVVFRPAHACETAEMRIDLNRADAQQLQQIAGIGPVLSEAIVAWREENGPFRRTEDLLQVPGIGEKTLEAIRDELVIGGIDEDPGRG